jgi:DNA-binding transcriptional ArsR family regulator
LLAHAWASGGDFDLTKHPSVWVRALGLSDDQAGRRTVLRNWKALAELKLVTVERSGRWMKVTLLAEDGSERPYRHPGEKDAREDYFQLPYAYWRDELHARLKVPGKTVLLISLTLGDWFWLPPRHAGGWYGVSASTIERGLRELRREGVLEARSHFKKAPLAPEGYTRELYYRLKPPFGPKGTLAGGAPEELALLSRLESSAQAKEPRRKPKRRTPAAGNAKAAKAKSATPGG